MYTILRVLRFLYKKCIVGSLYYSSSSLIEYYDNEANDYIFDRLKNTNEEGLMIAKFGTFELSILITYLYQYKKKPRIYFRNLVTSTLTSLNIEKLIDNAFINAGIFPPNKEALCCMAERYINDIGQIDILASYQLNEKLIKSAMPNCHYVNLDGFYAPFKFEAPWTRYLEDKDVLIIHPFVETIKYQYENNRETLFDNPKVLPKFRSIQYIKAVQTAAEGADLEKFKSWNDALNFMEYEIDTKKFDVALIGCGAYGLPLAAHVKRLGKTAIHLAGWTQMLFGIYGKRWLEDMPEYKKYIKPTWIRPSENERPHKANLVEGGCYW